MDLHVFFKPTHQALGAEYASTAVKAFTYYITQYGVAPSPRLQVVEIPDDTVPSAWAPEIAALASRAISEKVNYRLLANTIAHQWWGVEVSPATKDDWWISDGFARYSEARYVESAAGETGLEEMVKDMSVGALAYDSVPLSSADKLDYFSPEFQSLVTDKGAMILHMLRYVLGENKYLKVMREFATKYAGKSASTDDFRKLVEQVDGEKLTWFFSQWMDSTERARVQDQVHGLPAGQQQGLPDRGRDPAGPRSVPHAGEVAHRHGRQDGREAHRGGGHRFAVLGGDFRTAAADLGGSGKPCADQFQGHQAAGVDRARTGPDATRRSGRGAERVQQGARSQQEQLARALPGCGSVLSCKRTINRPRTPIASP